MSASNPEDERRLFREAVRDVKPLKQPARVREGPKPAPRARFARADRLAVLEESLQDERLDPALEGGETLAFQRVGLRPGVLRRLRRGEYRVEGEIDLHGLTAAQAKQALREFLSEALRRNWRCVRIVHGKGLRSGHRGPVLKGTVAAVLRRLDPVLAFVSARPVDGGTGALYVLLRA